MDDQMLSVTREGSLLTLKLDRPHVLNALTLELLGEVSTALQEAAQPTVRAVLLTGNGRGFCAGADLGATELTGNAAEIVKTHYNPVARSLRALEKPVIAAVNGVAAGAGMSLALACDLRLLSEKAVFAVGFAGIGLAMDASMSYTLPRLVGTTRAFELAYSGRKVSAEEALELGLGEQILPADGFLEAATAYAKALADGPTQCYARIKRQLYASAHNTFDEQLALEAELQDEASQTEDFREGVQAFAEKRAPRFRGV